MLVGVRVDFFLCERPINSQFPLWTVITEQVCALGGSTDQTVNCRKACRKNKTPIQNAVHESIIHLMTALFSAPGVVRLLRWATEASLAGKQWCCQTGFIWWMHSDAGLSDFRHTDMSTQMTSEHNTVCQTSLWENGNVKYKFVCLLSPLWLHSHVMVSMPPGCLLWKRPRARFSSDMGMSQHVPGGDARSGHGQSNLGFSVETATPATQTRISRRWKSALLSFVFLCQAGTWNKIGNSLDCSNMKEGHER